MTFPPSSMHVFVFSTYYVIHFEHFVKKKTRFEADDKGLCELQYCLNRVLLYRETKRAIIKTSSQRVVQCAAVLPTIL